MWLPSTFSSLSDKGPSEDLRPEERPVEGKALTTSPSLRPPLPLISPFSLFNTSFGDGVQWVA